LYLVPLYDCAAIFGVRSPCFALDSGEIKAADRDTKNEAESQSGAGVPHSKVRPERLTGRVPVNSDY